MFNARIGIIGGSGLYEMEGVDVFMTKPFDISALEGKLLEVLSKSK